MKFACCIPLYHPDNDICDVLEEYFKVFTKVYIFDNTENGSSKDIIKYIESKGGEILATGDNEGLAYAYNQCCLKAVLEEIAFLALFDQDSTPNANNIALLQNYICENASENVAIYGPEIFKKGEKIFVSDQIEEVSLMVSSGSFINLNVYKQTNGFDEKLFIDMVDTDYCLTVRELGFKIVKVGKSFMIHNIGIPKRFLWKEVNQHTALRMYYMTRNTLYCKQKHGEKVNILFYILDRMRHVLVYEDDKLDKCRMIIKGYRDFINNKFGKLCV